MGQRQQQQQQQKQQQQQPQRGRTRSHTGNVVVAWSNSRPRSPPVYAGVSVHGSNPYTGAAGTYADGFGATYKNVSTTNTHSATKTKNSNNTHSLLQPQLQSHDLSRSRSRSHSHNRSAGAGGGSVGGRARWENRVAFVPTVTHGQSQNDDNDGNNARRSQHEHENADGGGVGVAVEGVSLRKPPVPVQKQHKQQYQQQYHAANGHSHSDRDLGLEQKSARGSAFASPRQGGLTSRDAGTTSGLTFAVLEKLAPATAAALRVLAEPHLQPLPQPPPQPLPMFSLPQPLPQLQSESQVASRSSPPLSARQKLLQRLNSRRSNALDQLHSNSGSSSSSSILNTSLPHAELSSAVAYHGTLNDSAYMSIEDFVQRQAAERAYLATEPTPRYPPKPFGEIGDIEYELGHGEANETQDVLLQRLLAHDPEKQQKQQQDAANDDNSNSKNNDHKDKDGQEEEDECTISPAHISGDVSSVSGDLSSTSPADLSSPREDFDDLITPRPQFFDPSAHSYISAAHSTGGYNRGPSAHGHSVHGHSARGHSVHGHSVGGFNSAYSEAADALAPGLSARSGASVGSNDLTGLTDITDSAGAGVGASELALPTVTLARFLNTAAVSAAHGHPRSTAHSRNVAAQRLGIEADDCESGGSTPHGHRPAPAHGHPAAHSHPASDQGHHAPASAPAPAHSHSESAHSHDRDHAHCDMSSAKPCSCCADSHSLSHCHCHCRCCCCCPHRGQGPLDQSKYLHPPRHQSDSTCTGAAAAAAAAVRGTYTHSRQNINTVGSAYSKSAVNADKSRVIYGGDDDDDDDDDSAFEDRRLRAVLTQLAREAREEVEEYRRSEQRRRDAAAAALEMDQNALIAALSTRTSASDWNNTASGVGVAAATPSYNSSAGAAAGTSSAASSSLTSNAIASADPVNGAMGALSAGIDVDIDSDDMLAAINDIMLTDCVSPLTSAKSNDISDNGNNNNASNSGVTSAVTDGSVPTVVNSAALTVPSGVAPTIVTGELLTVAEEGEEEEEDGVLVPTVTDNHTNANATSAN